MMRTLLASIAFFICQLAAAQQCTTLGQTPNTAFPVCGTTTFQQLTVPICETQDVVVPGCQDGAAYQDKNPFWYKFTCYQAGTLGFLIQPLAANEDYDWQLYDITGHNPNDVFTNVSLVVTANWAGTYGNTGASSAGTNVVECSSSPTAVPRKNTFAPMPTLQVGHTYILLISHFTNSQSGYNLSFGGGTAVITDPTIPRFKTADIHCTGQVIHLKLSKKVYCKTLTANGSEFYITGSNGVTVTGAAGVDCSSNFDTDSFNISLSAPLSPGSYYLHIRKSPGDGNTLLDYCDNAVPETDSLPFVLQPKFPTPMDSLLPITCAPKELRLFFKNAIQCSSIDPAGKDFTITGSYPASIVGAAGANCVNGVSKEIVITLGAPLQRAGTFTLAIRNGDGNTVVDECGEQTLPGSSISFSVKDTVNADFTYEIGYDCVKDAIHYFHPTGNGVNSWTWNLDEGQQSTVQNPTGIYSVFNEKTITLAVSNGLCKDTSTQKIMLQNALTIDFEAPTETCPKEAVAFTDKSVGKSLHYFWEFGDGATSDSTNPHHVYSGAARDAFYNVKLTVTDSFGCAKTIVRRVFVYSSCFLAVPNAFTPNNDGTNDRFRVLNAVKTENFELQVYNRWGQRVFRTTNWKEGWDGKVRGIEQGTGVYVWMLTYTDPGTKQKVEQKGTMVLIR